METGRFPLALTFDDILLIPGYTDFSRDDIDLSSNFTKKIKLRLPFVSAPMDTVTESRLAITLAELGGIGIIHRNLSISEQANKVGKVKAKNLLVGAAIGVSVGYKERLEALIKAGVDVVVLDSAHGWTNKFIEAMTFIKNNYKIELVVGNIATFEAAEALCKNGADALRVGMGPGAICTTRVVSGMGVPQVSAIAETFLAAKKYKVPVIADGGVKYSGDMVKALAVGASTIMMGSLFASCAESPGKVVVLTKSLVPARFKSIFGQQSKALQDILYGAHKELTVTNGSLDKIEESYYFKEYRGMGSVGAMEQGAKIKSEDEFHGKSYKERVLVAEGVEGLVPIKGTVKDFVEQAVGGIKSGLYYAGTKNISELQKKAVVVQITQASLQESHPHDVFITNPGASY